MRAAVSAVVRPAPALGLHPAAGGAVPSPPGRAGALAGTALGAFAPAARRRGFTPLPAAGSCFQHGLHRLFPPGRPSPPRRMGNIPDKRRRDKGLRLSESVAERRRHRTFSVVAAPAAGTRRTRPFPAYDRYGQGLRNQRILPEHAVMSGRMNTNMPV